MLLSTLSVKLCWPLPGIERVLVTEEVDDDCNNDQGTGTSLPLLDAEPSIEVVSDLVPPCAPPMSSL